MKASEIDWSKAPEWATGYGFIKTTDVDVWVSDDCYTYVGEQQSGRVFSIKHGEGWSLDEIRVVSSRPSVWNGTGLPPAGCEIEYHSPSRGWQPGEYIGQFNGQMVIGCRETGVIGYCPAEIVRPIRTPEQIAAEERAEAARQMCKDAGRPECTRAQMEQALKLYDAGWRKVEGDKQ